MWSCILIGLNFITMVVGFASRPFPESCGSMLPEHVVDGVPASPQTTVPLFEIQYEQGNNDEPITVILKSKQSTPFQGFMLEARERGKVDEGVPVGKFIILNPNTELMSCSGSEDSSVTQANNQLKTLIKVNWTAQGADLDITFRATFVQTFKTFWDRVDVNVTSAKPSPATSTTESHTGTITTKMTTTNINDSYQHSLTREEGFVILMCTNCFVEILIMMVILLDGYICLAIDKWFNISSSVFCAGVEIAAWVLIFDGDFCDVTLTALVCVVTVINLIELIMASLPLIRDVQKWKCDLAVTVCALLQVFFTIAIMYIGVLKLDACGSTRKVSWPLIVLITYTLWIYLFLAWAIIYRKIMLRKLVKWELNEEWKVCAAMSVIGVPVIIIVGAISFIVAIMAGIATC